MDLLAHHLLFVPRFMLSAHRLGAHKAVQGLRMALLKLNFWALRSPVTVTPAPGSAALLAYANVPHGPVPWYLTLPAYYLALLAGLLLSRRTLAGLAAAKAVSLLLVRALGLADTVVIAPWGRLP